MWKQILGYEKYEINTSGVIRRGTKILKNHTDSNKYESIMLCRNGVPRRFRVHRLVAQAHLPNPDNLPMVNHKNGIRSDNRIENLEWVTCSQNHKHSYEHLNRQPPKSMKGKFGKDHNRSKSFTLKMPDGQIRHFGSGLEAKRELGIDSTAISHARTNRKLPYTFKRGKLKNHTLIKAL